MKNFLIPSIDLLDENIVRLYKGDYNQKTSYNIDIIELLDKYKNFENLHIVDLNGAKNDGLKNIEIIKKIRHNFAGKIQLGGGIRDVNKAQEMFDLKIDKVVIGTVAIKNFTLTKEILEKFTKEKIILAIDCKFENGKWMPKANGWLENQEFDLFQILHNYKNLAKYILITDIGVDGTMAGPNFKLYQDIKSQFPEFILQASGGVSSLQDLEKLQEITDFAIVGKALYQGLLDL